MLLLGGSSLIDWIALKDLAAYLFIEKDALHIYAAFIIQISSALILRRTVRSWLPWTIVLGLELLNEGADIWFGGEAYVQPWQLRGAVHDLVNTMLLPTALLLLCRYATGLFTDHGSHHRTPPPIPRGDDPGQVG